MIKFENVRVYNWIEAIRGMRNSWESWDRMDSYEDKDGVHVGSADLELMMKLSRAGSDHGKFLRQILVSVDVTAPEYWWKEADTYKVGTVANSTSMMHTLGKRRLTVHDFSFDKPNSTYVNAYLTLINQVREDWVESGKKKPSPEWRMLNQLVAISYLYRRTLTCNYQVLKSMYHSRKGHRLSEWREGFREWVESLPHSELITLKRGK